MSDESIIDVEKEGGEFTSQVDLWPGGNAAMVAGILRGKSSFSVNFPLPFEFPEIGEWVPLEFKPGDGSIFRGQAQVTDIVEEAGTETKATLIVRGLERADV